MIVWPIEAILKSGIFEAVVVSTDDEQIAEVARSNGAEAPFVRPSELCDDHTPTMPVVAHAIRWWEESRGSSEFYCCVYATSPFLRTDYLRQGLHLLRDKPDAEFAVSITSFAYPIFRALRISPTGKLELFWPKNEWTRSQDLPEAWHDAGQFYWGRRDAFLRCKNFFGPRSYPVVLPRHLVQDIDTTEDWDRAERMFAAFL
jgi:N-acylneuraminate cytidylyltransferase